MAESDMSSLLSKFDIGDMAGFTRRFVDDLEAAMAMDVDIEVDSDWSGVICLGMGGSGAGGRFLKSLADAEAGLPFAVWNDYGLPSWWGPDWLVLATSYSGDTEETLDGVREALESGGTVIGISSEGRCPRCSMGVMIVSYSRYLVVRHPARRLRTSSGLSLLPAGPWDSYLCPMLARCPAC